MSLPASLSGRLRLPLIAAPMFRVSGPDLVIAALGRLPKRGETVLAAGFRFNVLRADSRRVYTLIVEKQK